MKLQKASFHNRMPPVKPAATGARWTRAPANIDLDARLTRGSGASVWRYMPLAVGKNVREWLRVAIIGGKASETTLKLRGDLRRFPYRDGLGGVFEVRGKFRDATLRYADSWPEINDIEGELLFAGQRMLITGKKGRIFGVDLREVRAEIADIEQAEELLTVSGKAAGPTAEFLRFIEASPVGERIDHFTEGMRAEGRGELDLKLSLPLRRLSQSKVDGSYRFDGNRLTVDNDLPPLASARQPAFPPTISKRAASAARCSVLDGRRETAGDGNQSIPPANRQIATLRREFHNPCSTIWRAARNGPPTCRSGRTRRVRPDINLIDLLGLPAPFNKPLPPTLAFSFERKPPPSLRRAAPQS